MKIVKEIVRKNVQRSNTHVITISYWIMLLHPLNYQTALSGFNQWCETDKMSEECRMLSVECSETTELKRAITATECRVC